MLALPAARAGELNCFPTCTAAPLGEKVEKPAEKTAEPAPLNTAAPAETTEPVAVSAKKCNNELVAKVDELNDRAKPVKDIIGYVHSPQSLALKVVNDHVVKIPAWVGFALDPVGTVKGRAIDLARDHAREMAGIQKDDASCKAQAEPVEERAPADGKTAEQI